MAHGSGRFGIARRVAEWQGGRVLTRASGWGRRVGLPLSCVIARGGRFAVFVGLSRASLRGRLATHPVYTFIRG